MLKLWESMEYAGRAFRMVPHTLGVPEHDRDREAAYVAGTGCCCGIIEVLGVANTIPDMEKNSLAYRQNRLGWVVNSAVTGLPCMILCWPCLALGRGCGCIKAHDPYEYMRSPHESPYTANGMSLPRS